MFIPHSHWAQDSMEDRNLFFNSLYTCVNLGLPSISPHDKLCWLIYMTQINVWWLSFLEVSQLSIHKVTSFPRDYWLNCFDETQKCWESLNIILAIGYWKEVRFHKTFVIIIFIIQSPLEFFIVWVKFYVW